MNSGIKVIISVGVCFGLAVNGAIGNIAGGVLLITRPFRVDDYISVNGTASSASVTNFSEKELRSVDEDSCGARKGHSVPVRADGRSRHRQA